MFENIEKKYKTLAENRKKKIKIIIVSLVVMQFIFYRSRIDNSDYMFYEIVIFSNSQIYY